MKDENRDRMGDKFEREMSDLFQRIGFVVKNHVFTKKEDGKKSEQDVLATKGNLKILIQCKDYAKFPFENIEEVIKDLIEDGESLEADKLILAITGHKNLLEDYITKLKKKGIYLWNEDYWRKLQKLDLIDLYEEIGKNLEIKEVLKRVKDEEEQKLKSLYDKIDKIEDKKRKKSILEQLENIEFSDYTKREIQLRKIENEILLEKEKEVDEKAERDVEDIELEELFSLIRKPDFDFNKRYLILEKIKQSLELSKKSGKIIDVERIKTFIEKQEEDSSSENWGDERLDSLEELRDKGEISHEDYERLRGRVRGIGVSKKGEKNAEKKSFEYELKKAKSLAKRKRIFKIAKFSFILIISLASFFLIFSLFNNPQESYNNPNNLTNFSKNSSEVIDSNQDFLNFCKTKFNEASQSSKLYNYKYFEDYNEAKNYIYELFPEEIEINRNRAKFFTEWYLDNAEFPLYILQGSISNSPSLVENGYWVCDKNGIVERG
jgi:Holliday junction resolvase